MSTRVFTVNASVCTPLITIIFKKQKEKKEIGSSGAVSAARRNGIKGLVREMQCGFMP